MHIYLTFKDLPRQFTETCRTDGFLTLEGARLVDKEFVYYNKILVDKSSAFYKQIALQAVTRVCTYSVIGHETIDFTNITLIGAAINGGDIVWRYCIVCML